MTCAIVSLLKLSSMHSKEAGDALKVEFFVLLFAVVISVLSRVFIDDFAASPASQRKNFSPLLIA